MARQYHQAEQRTTAPDLHQMHHVSTLDSKLSDDILEILKASKTDSCSLFVTNVGAETETVYQSYQVQDDGKPKRIENDKGNLIYPIASVTKLIIAIALHLIVDIYSVSEKPEHKRYKLLNSWDLQYVERLNACSNREVLKSLPGNPSLEQLLIHLNGLPGLNRFLFAPDDTTMISKEGFIKLVASLGAFAERETSDWLEYSNANYILIGILIETISGMSLGDFIKTHILQPLKMNNTYVDLKDLETAPASSRVLPYIIDREGRRVEGRNRPLLSGVVEIAALGIYSCTSDLAKLYRALFPNSPDDGAFGILNEVSIRHLFGYNSADQQRHMSDATIKNFGPERWVAAGMVTKTAGKTLLGFRSGNHLALPDDSATNFALGTTPEDRNFDVYYQAGLVSTYSCSAYMVMRTGHVVVVMSNTLGRGDAADYGARLLLQDCLDLEVRDLDLSRLVRSPRHKVDVVDKARQGCGKFFDCWSKKLDICEMAGKPADLEIKKLQGLYKSDLFVHSLRIIIDGPELSVQFIGEKDLCSHKSRLSIIGTGKLMICPKHPSVDWFDAWEDLELHYENRADVEKVSRIWSNVGETGLVINYMRQS